MEYNTVSEKTDGVERIYTYPTDFKVGNEYNLVMIVTNKKYSYEASVLLKKGWSLIDLKEIINTTLNQSDSMVIKINSTFKNVKNEKLN